MVWKQSQNVMTTCTYRVINPVLLATSALNDAALCFAAASNILASRKLRLLSASSDSVR